MPPYFSTFSTAQPWEVLAGFGFSLKAGESLWLATIWKWFSPPSGTRKAITEEPLRVR